MKKNFKRNSLPILIGLLIMVSVKCFGQQQVQFSQYFANYLYHNPAFAGRNYQTDATLIHRQQWVGLEGAPKSTLFGLTTKLSKLNLGLGLNLIQDKIGDFSLTGLRIAVSSEKRFGLNSVRFALAPAIYVQSLNADFSAIDGVELDPSLANGKRAQTNFDLNLGLSFHASDYFLGLSVLNLLSARVNEIGTQYRRTAVVLAGYEFANIGIKNVSLQPTLLIKSDLQNISGLVVDVNALALYKQSLIFGLGYRSFDAIIPEVGYQWFSSLGKFRAIYSYDYTTSGINSVSKGSHEISLNYSYFIERMSTLDQYKDVRFL